MIAKEYETVINDLYMKNQSLKIENAMFKQQALAENKTTATAIKAEHEQHLKTVEYIKRLKEENERLQQQIDDIQHKSCFNGAEQNKPFGLNGYYQPRFSVDNEGKVVSSK